MHMHRYHENEKSNRKRTDLHPLESRPESQSNKAPLREVFERSDVDERSPREVFERSREASGVGRLETQR